MPGAHKIGAAIPAPELRVEILWTSRFSVKAARLQNETAPEKFLI